MKKLDKILIVLNILALILTIVLTTELVSIEQLPSASAPMPFITKIKTCRTYVNRITGQAYRVCW